jgi:hypothetical protein
MLNAYYAAGIGHTAQQLSDRRASQPEVAPLAPGQDPLSALDPEMRQLVTSMDPAPTAVEPDDFGLRLKTTLEGAGLGGAFGFVLVNGGSRYGAMTRMRPIDVPVTLAITGAGIALGGLIGGTNPQIFSKSAASAAKRDAVAATIPDLAPAQPQVGPAAPAFASLYA